jgi:hypothetical protein
MLRSTISVISAIGIQTTNKNYHWHWRCCGRIVRESNIRLYFASVACLQLMHVREEWTPAVGRVKIPACSKVGHFTPCPSLVGLW